MTDENKSICISIIVDEFESINSAGIMTDEIAVFTESDTIYINNHLSFYKYSDLK